MIYGFVPGGDYEKGFRCAQATGVHLCRSHDLDTGESAASVEAKVLYAAQHQIKLILLYNMGTSDMPLGNLVSHIARVGPTGTMWNSGQSGAGLGQWAPTHIECGNEWSYNYRGSPSANAVGVANSVQRFYNAVGPTLGSNAMKFICEAEDGGDGTSQFLDSLIATVPGIRSLLDGWTIHGYGPQVNEGSNGGFDAHQRMVNRLNARGYTTDKIWITENGISSDDGPSMVPDNYGFKVNCTYAEAATRLLAIARLHGSGLAWSSRIYCYLDYKAVDSTTSGSNQREDYFGIYKFNETAKGALTSAAITLVSEYPYTAAPPTTTPTPGGATAGGNPPSDGGSSGIITFVSQVGTSILPSANPWIVQGAGSGQSGDLVVIGLSQAQQSPTVTPPAGFTTDGTSTEGADGRLRVYYGYYSVVGPGPYSFAISGTQAGYAVCAYYRGVNTSTPLDAISVYSATAPSTAWATSALLPANTGAMIVAIAVCSPNAVGRTTTITAPATKRGGAENAAASLYVLGDLLLTTAASTSIAGTVTPAESMAIGVLALRAAPVVIIPPVSETPIRGGAVGDGRAPAIRAIAPNGGSGEAQGVGTASATYTSLTTYPSLVTYPSPFTTGLRARSGVIAGGAVSGGFAPPTGAPVSQSPTPGGALAGGFGTASVPVYPNATTYPGAATFPGATGVQAGVSARTLSPRGAAIAGGTSPADIQAAIPGGATADGRTPTVRSSVAAGGAIAAGQLAADRTPALPGGAIADGRGPLVRSALTPGGATAAGANQAATVTETPTPGGATAGGFVSAATFPNAATYPGATTYPGAAADSGGISPRSLVPRGGFIADGFSSPVGPTIRVVVAQGGAVAGGTAPARADIATAGGAVAGGAIPTVRTAVPAGGAVGDGFTFAEPPLPPQTTIGGGIAAGTEPTVRSAIAQGGAVADGTAPTPQTTATPTPGGADAGAKAPTASVAPGTGGAPAAGNATGSRSPLTAGGASAGGIDQQASEQSATPTPGGADAAGTGPYAWTTIAVGGAIAATNQITGATVLITPGGALAGGRFPHAPFIVSRHFDDDDGPVLAGAFDPGTQRGQT